MTPFSHPDGCPFPRFLPFSPVLVVYLELSVVSVCCTTGIRSGWNFNAVQKAFNAGLKRAYPYLDMPFIHDLVYGVPLDFVGLDLTDPDLIDTHPQYVDFLGEYLGLEPQTIAPTRWRSAYTCIDESDVESVFPLVKRLITSLIETDCQPWADLALMLMYLFGITDNSLLDWPHDAYYEAGFEPLEWEPDRLELANLASEQVAIVLAATERMLTLLNTDEEISITLKANIAALVAVERSTHVPNALTLVWPRRDADPRHSPTGAASPDASLLFVRRGFS